MIDPILSLAHTIHSGKGTMALLLGSGVSRNARIPTGWEVTLDLVRRLAVMQDEDAGADPALWYTARYGSVPGYSELLDALAKTPAERRDILHAIFEPTEDEREQGLKLPTEAHHAIAQLVAKGFVRVIVTTNFDRLTELALEAAGVTPVVVASADAVKGAAPIVHQRCVVLKVHGDYLDGRIKNTDAELSSYDPAMDSYLDRILDEFGLVVSGWSGDWDPALRAAIERCPSRRYATYWTGTSAPGPKAATLVHLRGAHSIKVDGADEFFGSLLDKVTSLAEMSSAAPLSVGAAVASVKRYVAEPRFRIRFDDLLADEVRRARARHDAELPMDARPVDDGTIRKRFHAYDASTEVLRNLLFHAARWAEPEHHDTIKRTVASLAPPERGDGVQMQVWSGMRLYPAMLAFHAACLGAYAAGNYPLLQALFRMNFRYSGHRRTALPELTASYAIEREHAKRLVDRPRHVAMSDHLAALFMPMLATCTADPERTFDRLEVLFALGYIDRSDVIASAERSMPYGRFAVSHHDSVYAELFEEAEIMGASWPPLAAGMFRSEPDRLEKVREAFMTALKALGKGPLW